MNGRRRLHPALRRATVGSHVVFAGFACAGALTAAPPPVLLDMEPHGAPQGAALRLLLAGYGLPHDMEIESSLPGAFARLGDADPNSGRIEFANLLLEIEADAAPGLYPIRLVTDDGISNALLFRVDTLPETSERELDEGGAEDTEDSPPYIAELPIVVNGTLEGPERDRYAFDAPAGERLVLEVEARRLGSAIDPVLRLFDAEGREVASNQDGRLIDVDARLDWQAPRQGGRYEIEVHDARFSRQQLNFYRLKLIRAENYEYAEAVFPLGVQRGQLTRLEVADGSSRSPRRMTRTVDGNTAFALIGPEPGRGRRSAALPFPVVVGESPERGESDREARHPLEPPFTVNGRIAKQGEVDRYRIAARPGQRLLIELEAAGLGTSELFGVITVATPGGDVLATAGDDVPDPDTTRLLSPSATSSDPWVLVETPDGADVLDITIEDLVGRGGKRLAYRLNVTEDAPDFKLRLSTPQVSIAAGATQTVRAIATRRGYLGPIRLYVEDPPDGMTVREGWIPAELRDLDRRTVSRSGLLTLTADPNAPRERLDLVVHGEGVRKDGTTIRRRATLPGVITFVRPGDGRSDTNEAERAFTAPWLESALPVLLTGRPGPRLLGAPPAEVRLVKGMPFHFDWTFEAPTANGEDIEPPERVSASINGGEFRIKTTEEDEYDQAEGTRILRSSEGTRYDRYTAVLSGTVIVGAREQVVYSPAVTVHVVPGYRVEVEKAEVRSGAAGTVKGSLHREESFGQPVTLRAEALPTGVLCHSTELAADEDGAFHIACEASEAVEPGEYEILVVSSSWLGGGDEARAPYATTPVAARMEVKAR